MLYWKASHDLLNQHTWEPYFSKPVNATFLIPAIALSEGLGVGTVELELLVLESSPIFSMLDECLAGGRIHILNQDSELNSSLKENSGTSKPRCQWTDFTCYIYR